jgi:hypothetical protein
VAFTVSTVGGEEEGVKVMSDWGTVTTLQAVDRAEDSIVVDAMMRFPITMRRISVTGPPAVPGQVRSF